MTTIVYYRRNNTYVQCQLSPTSSGAVQSSSLVSQPGGGHSQSLSAQHACKRNDKKKSYPRTERLRSGLQIRSQNGALCGLAQPSGYDKLSKPETRVQKLARCALQSRAYKSCEPLQDMICLKIYKIYSHHLPSTYLWHSQTSRCQSSTGLLPFLTICSHSQ